MFGFATPMLIIESIIFVQILIVEELLSIFISFKDIKKFIYLIHNIYV